MRKIQYIIENFESQKSKHWFDEQTFSAILRLRGMEANSPTMYAEAFYCRKLDAGLTRIADNPNRPGLGAK